MKPSRQGDGPSTRARILLAVVGLIVVASAIVSWESDRGRTTTEGVTRVTRPLGKGDGPHGNRVSTHKTVEAAGNSLRSQAVMVALLTLGGALLLSAAFWDRLSELEFAGINIKLLDRTFRQLRERSDDDPLKVVDALELVLKELGEAERRGESLDSKLTAAAVDDAVEAVSFDLEDAIEVRDEPHPEVVVNGEGSPARRPAYRVTTNFQYLPGGLFEDHFVKAMEKAVDEQGAQRLYVLDIEIQEVLAVAVFGLPPGNAPILLYAIGRRIAKSDSDLQARCLTAALLATEYLHHAAAMLGRPPGLFVAPEKPEGVELGRLRELHFRPAAPGEAANLPAADYWVKYPPG